MDINLNETASENASIKDETSDISIESKVPATESASRELFKNSAMKMVDGITRVTIKSVNGLLILDNPEVYKHNCKQQYIIFGTQSQLDASEEMLSLSAAWRKPLSIHGNTLRNNNG